MKTKPNQDISPYILYSMKLMHKARHGQGNMFRHQMETLALLLVNGYAEPVLLKAVLNIF